ncbi:ornithine cyclodeaminase family protein [Zavarzinia compransoris]|uniref:Ornithine cyclodeaminase family protein n=1 Tax=Zavarzinia compransoris TaxID=1264899 RepID=A0A317DTP1_9PROT|nr:ornithine cyclodeaminase family protein [Zavarzinia compransoris]PWR17732.1 ornithine cyclodeaminase family protein [Zavarzinia compransoris]TDP49255.1 ornithine cyclodeaminase [Zavarzinia compransoris]
MSGPRHVEAGAALAALTYPGLIDALRDAFAAGTVTAPLRGHYPMADGAGNTNIFLVMPAYDAGAYAGVKLVTVAPGNNARGLDSVIGLYVLFDAVTGAPLLTVDGSAITVRRTPAASALAARYLARPEAETLLVVGAGKLAPHVIDAYRAVLPRLRRVLVWNRTADKAAAVAARSGAEVAPDLAAAVAAADVVSAITMSKAPLIRGDWLRPGTHLDLIGGFTPEMREADDSAVTRASLFVDTREGALHEAGDLADPLKRGVIAAGDISADLADLVTGRHPGRRSAEEITLFKSVGTALEDLAAAAFLHRSGPA